MVIRVVSFVIYSHYAFLVIYRNRVIRNYRTAEVDNHRSSLWRNGYLNSSLIPPAPAKRSTKVTGFLPSRNSFFSAIERNLLKSDCKVNHFLGKGFFY